MSQQQFENFTASALYCGKCRASMPVRERLLLILPDRDTAIAACGHVGGLRLRGLLILIGTGMSHHTRIGMITYV